MRGNLKLLSPYTSTGVLIKEWADSFAPESSGHYWLKCSFPEALSPFPPIESGPGG